MNKMDRNYRTSTESLLLKVSSRQRLEKVALEKGVLFTMAEIILLYIV